MGIVEVDETYFGGKQKNRHASKSKPIGGGVGVMGALKDCGVPIGPVRYEMPPGEWLKRPTVLHCPGGTTSADDPLYKAMNACGIHVGLTSLTTLSLEMPTATPLDIGRVFTFLPSGSSLPDDEYVLWVGG